MLLTVDISNSRITLGGFAETDTGFDRELRFMAQIDTDRHRTTDQYACDLMQVLPLHNAAVKDIRHAIICSVVPELTTVFQDAVYKLTNILPLVLGPGIKTGLHVLLDNPAQLGSDLVAGAVAAAQLYPLPCAIFDLGTATTISVLDGNGKFRGGIICAGVTMTLDSLAANTSLLPNVPIACPKKVIGTNTIHSMQSGAVYGTAAMMDGMVDRIEAELGEPVTVVATGSLAQTIAPVCRKSVHVCENLLLTGMRIIYEKNHPHCE